MKRTARTFAACVALLPASVAPVSAQPHVVDTIIGIGGALLLNEINRSQQQQSAPSRTTTNVAQSSAREQRRDIQRRLNLLGYDAGTVDGIFGSRTRAAISRFQASIGAVPSGQLTQDQIARLQAMTTPGAAVGGTPGGQAGAWAGQPPAPQFPSVGGTPGGQPGAPEFPAVGGGQGAQPAAPQFPAIGGGTAGQPAGNAPAFPTVGGSEGAQAAGPDFPAVGGNPGADTAAPGFPALGGGEGANTAAPAFPALGGKGEAAPSAEAEFPTLFGPEDAGADSAAYPELEGGAPEAGFPAIGPGEGEGEQPIELGLPEPAEGSEGFPAIAAQPDQTSSPAWLEAVYGQSSAEDYDFEQLLAGTPYGDAADQPKIFGIMLGSTFNAGLAALTERGFENCSDAESAFVQCTRQGEGISEAVLMARTDDGTVWALERSVEFDVPLASEIALESLRTPYPELVNAGVIANAECNPAQLSELASVSHDAVPALLRSSQQAANEALACPLVYALRVEPEGDVDWFTVRFLDLSSLIKEIIAETEAQRQQEVERMTEITERLEF